MADSSIRLVVTGENQSREAVNDFNVHMRESGRVVADVTNQLVGRFSPGMDNAIRAIAQMGVGLNRLSSGMTGLGGVAFGVAATIAGQYVDAWNKARESTLEYTRAMASMDFARVGAESNKLRLDLEGLRETYDKLTRAQKELSVATLNLPLLPGRQEQAARVLGLGIRDSAKEYGLAYEKFIGSQENAAALQALDQSQAARLEQIKRQDAQRSLYDFRLSAIDAEYQQSLRQAADLAGGVGVLSQDPAAAARLRGAAAERRRFRFAGELLGPGIQSASAGFEGFEGGLLTGPTSMEVQAGIQRREIEAITKLQQSIDQDLLKPGSGAGLEQIGVGVTLAETSAGIKARIVDTISLKEIDVERSRVLAEQVGLTASQQASIQSIIIEQQRRLDIEKAQGNVDKENLANDIAGIRQQAIARAELERATVLGGISKAALTIGDDWAAAGRRAEETFTSTANTIQGTLASILRGDQLGKDFATTFLKSMKDIFADQLSKVIVGSIANNLRGLLGGGGGLLGGGGGGGFFDVSGSSPSTLSTLLQQGYNLIAGPGGSTLASASSAYTGPGGVSASPGGSSFSPLGLPVGPALNYASPYLNLAADFAFRKTAELGLQPYGSLLAYEQSYGVVQGSPAYYGSTSVSSAVSASTPTFGSGVTSAGILSAAARLGFGIYDVANLPPGYSAGETTLALLHQIGQSSADLYSGGLAELGPLLGNLIGTDNAFGNFLVYGGFSFVHPSIPRRVREAISVQKVLVPQVNDFINNWILKATTVEELFQTLVTWSSGYFGGTSQGLAIIIRVNGKVIGGGAFTSYAAQVSPGGYATIDDLLDHPETLTVSVQYGVSQHFLDDANDAIKSAIVAKVAQLNAILAPLPFGYVERGYLTDATGALDRSSPYITKTTMQVAGAISLGQLKPGTQDLFFSSDVYRQMGIDEATIGSMIRRLNTYTINRDMLTDISSQRFLAAFGGA